MKALCILLSLSLFFNKVSYNGISCLVLLLTIISRVFQLILVKLFKTVYTLIPQDCSLEVFPAELN